MADNTIFNVLEILLKRFGNLMSALVGLYTCMFHNEPMVLQEMFPEDENPEEEMIEKPVFDYDPEIDDDDEGN